MIEVSILSAIGVALFMVCAIAARRATRIRRQEEKLAAAFERAQAARKRGRGLGTSLYNDSVWLQIGRR
jgi:hypothetical protein